MPLGPLAATLVVAVNLRVTVTSVPPLLGALRHVFALSLLEAALITSLPLVCFGLLGPVGALAIRRVGLGRALLAAVAVEAAGLALRLGPNAATLIGGTVLAGAGVAMANVTMPALVKDMFGSRMGLATGLYTTVMGLFAAVAAGLSAPLAALAGGWRLGLGVWLVPCLLALGLWLRVGAGAGPSVGHAPQGTAARGPSLRRALADPVVRRLTLFMGMQSLGYYAVLSWLPALMASHGASATTAGLYLSLQGLVGMPLGLFLPAVAHRMRDPRALVAATSTLTLFGLVGLAAAPMAAPAVWVILVGLGQGATFPLALTLIGLRSRGGAETAAVSTFVQSGGYVLAAAGPFALALLRQASHGWTLPLGALAALTLVQVVAGAAAAAPVQAFAEPAAGGVMACDLP